MPEQDEMLNQNRRLQDITQQTRVRVAESTLSVVLTLCTAAETYLNLGDPAQASSFIEEAEQMAVAARLSIAAIHDPPVALLHGQLTKLEDRIRTLRLRLDSKTESGADGNIQR